MAAHLQIASVGEYVDEKEDFESYVERLEAWLVVNSRHTETAVSRSKLNVGQGTTTCYDYVNGYRKYG